MEKFRVIISREMFSEKRLIIIIILDRMIKKRRNLPVPSSQKIMYYFVSNVSQSVSALRVTSVIVLLPILMVEAVQLLSAQNGKSSLHKVHFVPWEFTSVIHIQNEASCHLSSFNLVVSLSKEAVCAVYAHVYHTIYPENIQFKL